MPNNNELELIRDIASLYDLSLNVLSEFEGPSIYFHVQAIQEQQRSFLSLRHIEMIYATLASWGMHRMGDPSIAKAKMVRFEDFRIPLVSQKDALSPFLDTGMATTSEMEYRSAIKALKPIYCALRVSISSATLVAHSKTLAHVLPNLVPPIDRQYTHKFFSQDNKDFFYSSGGDKQGDLPKGIDAQFDLFVDYCCRIKWMFDHCDHQLFTLDGNTFNTSYPKIMDNVIVAFVKNVPKPPKKKRGSRITPAFSS